MRRKRLKRKWRRWIAQFGFYRTPAHQFDCVDLTTMLKPKEPK
jgi:hypothetical protein